MHVLSLPPAFVLSQDQTLKLMRSDWLAGHARIDENFHTASFARCRFYSLSKREPPKSRCGTIGQTVVPASPCRPRFSFFHIQFSKNRNRDAASWASAFGFGPVECRSRGSLDFRGRTILSPAARRPRCGGCIGGVSLGCQHRFCGFLHFFERPPSPRFFDLWVPSRQPPAGPHSSRIAKLGRSLTWRLLGRTSPRATRSHEGLALEQCGRNRGNHRRAGR